MLLRAAPFIVSNVSAGAAPAEDAARWVPRFKGALTSLDQLDRAAVGHGLISIEATGGVIRRIPLVANIGGTLVPALAIEMLRVAVGAPVLRLLTDGPAVLGISVGGFAARTEEDGAARVYYSPSSSGRYISAVDVLDGKFDPERIAQKLVLIGVTGVGMVDDKNTPLGSLMPGVEIHAQLLENLFDQTLLRRPAWAPRVEALVVPPPRRAARLRDAAMERAQLRAARPRLRRGARPRRIRGVSTAAAACSTPRCRDRRSRCCS